MPMTTAVARVVSKPTAVPVTMFVAGPVFDALTINYSQLWGRTGGLVMPRTRYTRVIRIRERAALARQEKALTALAVVLRRGTTQQLRLVAADDTKEQRRDRLAQKRLRKVRVPTAEPSARISERN